MLGKDIQVSNLLSKKLTTNFAKKVRETMIRKPVAQLDGGAFRQESCLSLNEYREMK